MANNCNKCKDCWNATKSSACSCSDTISYKELTSLRYDPLNPSQLQYTDNAGKVVNLTPPNISGTINKVAKFTGTNAVGDSLITDNGASVGIGEANPDASSILDIGSTNKGFLPPRMTNTQLNAISSPAVGLTVYDTTNNNLTYYNGTTWIAV